MEYLYKGLVNYRKTSELTTISDVDESQEQKKPNSTRHSIIPFIWSIDTKVNSMPFAYIYLVTTLKSKGRMQKIWWWLLGIERRGRETGWDWRPAFRPRKRYQVNRCLSKCCIAIFVLYTYFILFWYLHNI